MNNADGLCAAFRLADIERSSTEQGRLHAEQIIREVARERGVVVRDAARAVLRALVDNYFEDVAAQEAPIASVSSMLQ